MAEAIIAGMVKMQIVKPDSISATNRSNPVRLNQLADAHGIQADPALKYRYIQEADILILAMKPKDIKNTVEEIGEYTTKDHVVVSVAAGIKTETISGLLGHEAPIVRTMPNTSALVGQSATGLCGGKTAQEEHIEVTSKIFESIGSVFRIPEENMDALTAVSGSGPAFFYYFVEAMLDGAKSVGLEEGLAKELVLQTMLGATSMLMQSGKEPSELREAICSPGGTTLAGLDVLQSHSLNDTVKACVEAATKRAVELGKMNA
ncbi:pyrroline-5-carboxylate reductase [Paenibacillus abyssi]|uniref:Pyrroline-5-carboxylate reductase n=2 Tax=Paenibacillus abyssi TaxID=1340531 RepID=A0A917CT76_9BACL|nr:pyrroline-5-carboxylate reductase [Paenibacillus abyssi]